MKKLIGILTGSIGALVLVCIVYSGRQTIQSSYADNRINMNYTKSDIANNGVTLSDELPTVISTTREVPTSPQGADANKKVDYKPLDGSGSLVTQPQEVAKAAQEYSFSVQMYPYRAMLSSSEQSVYDQVYENALNQITTFSISESLTQSGINNVMTAIYNDHPELFWIDNKYSYGYTDKGVVVSLTLKYNSTVDDLDSSKEKFETAANKIIEGALQYTSNLDREKYVYKAIMDIATYDEDSELNQSAYSVLVGGESVCAGYARAFQYILMRLNIPCYFCSGYANEGYHAWNIVQIDGKYYNTDISWDDSTSEMSGIASYVYFNLSDSTMSVDHTRRDMSLNLPKCN